MKVKELLDILQQFNPNANVCVEYHGLLQVVNGYSWYNNDGAESSQEIRDIDKEKLGADAISLTYGLNRNEK